MEDSDNSKKSDTYKSSINNEQFIDSEIEGLGKCRFCGRKFGLDRLPKHESICEKASKKKVKVFDARKMRMIGTDAAQYIKKVEADEKKGKPKRPDSSKYKLEHQKLINQLKAARGAAPVYEEVDTRIQCPYCGRKFGEEAYNRHVKTCEKVNGGEKKTLKR